ncbi:MAG: protoporphyrinogen oxidase [Mycobacterium sp.]|nr:protoporphyrinogen oxidase [Mycobacterium sp.]
MTGHVGAARHVVVVGGGMSGLAAALAVRAAAPVGTRITVVEQSGRLGGKLRTGEIAGLPTELGAETFLVRTPEVVHLARSVGLDLQNPVAASASLLVDGVLRPLPGGTLLGVPTDPDAVEASRVLPAAAIARLRAEPDEPGTPLGDADIAVGALLRPRLGDAVVDRLVDPLLGGVYAGRADLLSLDVTVPALAATARRHASVVRAARAARDAAPAASGPVFGSVPGGLSRLVEAVAAASGAEFRLGLPVRELRRTATGWRLVVGSPRDPEPLDADAVVLAVPASPAARLLGAVSAAAAADVGVLDYASVGLVTLALPEGELPAGSGLLVPATEGLTVKAVTFLSQKWGTPGRIVRASVGRYGEEAVLQRSDEELVAAVTADLGRIIGAPVRPLETRVTRWGGALPQYAPGHRDRVRRARAALEEYGTLALAGAAYDGVGIPACVRSGTAAGTRVGQALRTGAESAHGR